MADSENWYRISRIDENTFCISESRHWEETNCYLLIGEKRALLIDTGIGAGDISEQLKKLTDKPVTAIPTHVHWDHIGGLRSFEDFYVHEAEREWIEEKFPLPDDFIRNMIVKGNTLPDEFDADSYAVFRGKAKKLLRGGEEIALGGRTIKVIASPGHSPGHMCFFEEEKGYLFTGDLIYKGTLFANYDSTDPVAYLDSVKRISKLSVRRIFPGHHETDISPEIITDVLKGLCSIDEKGLLRHGSGKFDFGEWSILL